MCSTKEVAVKAPAPPKAAGSAGVASDEVAGAAPYQMMPGGVEGSK